MIVGMIKKLPLNLVYLKYFCDAVKEKSISKSAKENFVSQSAISQGISKLEDLLQIKLTAHEPNRFKPTPEGLLLFEESKKVFSSIEELEEALAYQGTHYQGQVRFACMHSFALAFLSKPIALQKKKYPGLSIHFKMASPDAIKKMLHVGAIDFGIVLDNEDFSDYECKLLYQGHYHLYTSEKKPITYDHSDQEKFICSEQRRETNLLKYNYHQKFQKELPVLMEISSWEVIANLTEEGLGIGFFPDYIAKRKKLIKLDLGLSPIPYKVYALFPKMGKKHKNSEIFLNLFQEAHS